MEADSAEVLVKFEGLNVGGSIKTRTAYAMLQAAEREGLIHAGSLIVEPTSGNQGIGLALVGAVKGYKTVIVMPDSVSAERRKLIAGYGAKVVLVHDGGATDGFCSGIGTGGTITGIGKVLKEKFPNIEIWAVEPENAAVLAGGSVGTHLQMGIGDGVVPPVLDKSIYNDICIISDEEAIGTSRALAQKEGIMCGITGGTNVAAALRLAKKLGSGKRVVTVLPDTAERYFSTPLFTD